MSKPLTYAVLEQSMRRIVAISNLPAGLTIESIDFMSSGWINVAAFDSDRFGLCLMSCSVSMGDGLSQ